MIRLFTKDATGVAPNGRFYPGDINAFQDAVAALTDLAQTLSVGSLAVGESGLQVLHYGTLEARLTGAFRTDGILRGLGGIWGGTFTTTQRDAIALGHRPYGLIILNTTTNRYEWNAGSDAAPSWLPVGPTGPWGTADIVDGAITSAKILDGTIATGDLADGSVTSAKIADGTIVTGDLADSSVTSAKIVDGTIVDGDIAADTITARVIAANAITSSELADLSVDTAAIQDGAVTSAKILDGTITATDLASSVIGTYVKSGTLSARPSSSLVAGMVYTATDVNGGTTYEYNGSTWVPTGAGVITGYGTSLPGSPVDGQEFIFVDSTSNPAYQWRFRYNAGSLSPFKWEAIGSTPLRAVGNATLTLPAHAGDYEIAISGNMTAGVASGINPATATATPSSGVVSGRNSLEVFDGVPIGGNYNVTADCAALFVVTGAAASTTITWTGNTGNLVSGAIVARPIRVS